MATRYDPVLDGFSLRDAQVRYAERQPPKDLADVVHVFWELRTLAPLPADFLYHAVPDACVNLLFNQITHPAAELVGVDPAFAGESGYRRAGARARSHEFGLGHLVVHAATVALAPDHEPPSQFIHTV